AAGRASTTAMTVVTMVPYRYAAAPKTSLTGSQVVVVRNESPFRRREVSDSMTMRSAMPASVSGTMRASAVTLAANARSMRREDALCALLGRECRLASRHDRLDLLFGLQLRVLRKRGVTQLLRERLAVVRAPPEVPRHRQGLCLVADVGVGKDIGEGRDRPCGRIGRVGDRDAQVRGIGDAGCGDGHRVERRLDELAGRVLHGRGAELLLRGVDELDGPDRGRGGPHRPLDTPVP